MTFLQNHTTTLHVLDFTFLREWLEGWSFWAATFADRHKGEKQFYMSNYKLSMPHLLN